MHCSKGFKVLPWGKTKKSPVTKNGSKDATDDPKEVERLFSKPDLNIKFATGQRSDGTYLIVLDTDKRYGGDSQWAELVRQNPDINLNTPMVRTGGGGLNIYFESDKPVRNTLADLGAGIETLCEGKTVTAPPSRYEGGDQYEWIRDPSKGNFPKA